MITRIGCSLETYYWYIKLTVTDAAGLSTVDSSKIFPNCGSPLPVILGFFGAKKTDTANVLSWITEAEINLSQFEVQRSFDGLNFIPVARVNALRPQGRGRYEYADTEFLPGYNFYRLKMIDFDGTGTYSNTIKVANDLPTDHTLQVYPSPAAGYFIVSSNFNKAGPVLFSLSDINGKLLKKWTVTAIPGINSFRFSNLEGLNAGLMIITAQQDAAIKNAKLIINR
jgi:hypothetical protein